MAAIKRLLLMFESLPPAIKILRKLVADGLFREDLFYRLDVLPMNWPALRERPDDIIPLANYFIERYASQRGYRLSERACQLLLSYEWPGNVRELDNVIQRSLIMARGLHIQAVDSDAATLCGRARNG